MRDGIEEIGLDESVKIVDHIPETCSAIIHCNILCDFCAAEDPSCLADSDGIIIMSF